MAIQRRTKELTTCWNEVVTEFVSHLQSQLGVETPRSALQIDVFSNEKTITATQIAQLIKPLTPEEIKHALFIIGDERAPRLMSSKTNVFGAKFYKQAWSVIQNDFQSAIAQFFQTGQMLKQWKHTLNSHATTVQDFRPISCCKVFYKVISRILTIR